MEVDEHIDPWTYDTTFAYPVQRQYQHYTSLDFVFHCVSYHSMPL